MIFKDFCVLVPQTKVVSALKGLNPENWAIGCWNVLLDSRFILIHHMTKVDQTFIGLSNMNNLVGLGIGCNFMIDNQLQPTDRLSIIISSSHFCSNWVLEV